MNAERSDSTVRGFEVDNIFNSISDYVSIHDRDFRIIRANPAFCAFLGQTEDELIGQKCYTIFHDRSSNWPNCPHARMMDRKIPVTELIEDIHIGIPLQITCSPVYDGNGQILGSVHIARDVSEERIEVQNKDRIIAQLRATLMELKGLSGILTICASCKDIRNEAGEWERIEKYIADNTNAITSHGICPNCYSKLHPRFEDY